MESVAIPCVLQTPSCISNYILMSMA
jgi:hypothetical protein